MNNKRGTEKPIPEDMSEYLTLDQRISLSTYERFGWTLYFVRRPLFQEKLVVLCQTRNSMGQEPSLTIALLHPDGSFEENPEIPLRSSEAFSNTAPQY